MHNFKILLVAIGLFTAPFAHAVDMNEVEKMLTTTGVEGWVHGAVETQGMYVFTYRNPQNFFDYVQMSLLITKQSKPEAAGILASVKRHDKVRIIGSFLKNPSPQKHISITSIEVLKKYESPYPTTPGAHPAEAPLPAELLAATNATFLVHAVAGEGKILVLEYKNTIVPMYVKAPELTKDLYRNDLVKISYTVQKEPHSPTHLRLDAKAEKPVEMLQSIKSINGKPGTIKGSLILFPKSPEITINVFAVEEKLQEGLSRQYTIVNFENDEVFTELRKQMQAAWDRHPGAYEAARNKLRSTKINVEVTGTLNLVSPSQANPQVLVNALSDLKIIEATE